jgi:hypothetical protein
MTVTLEKYICEKENLNLIPVIEHGDERNAVL